MNASNIEKSPGKSIYTYISTIESHKISLSPDCMHPGEKYMIKYITKFHDQ